MLQKSTLHRKIIRRPSCHLSDLRKPIHTYLKMCWQTTCKSCKKKTWGGCGGHSESLHRFSSGGFVAVVFSGRFVAVRFRSKVSPNYSERETGPMRGTRLQRRSKRQETGLLQYGLGFCVARAVRGLRGRSKP